MLIVEKLWDPEVDVWMSDHHDRYWRAQNKRWYHRMLPYLKDNKEIREMFRKLYLS